MGTNVDRALANGLLGPHLEQQHLAYHINQSPDRVVAELEKALVSRFLRSRSGMGGDSSGQTRTMLLQHDGPRHQQAWDTVVAWLKEHVNSADKMVIKCVPRKTNCVVRLTFAAKQVLVATD